MFDSLTAPALIAILSGVQPAHLLGLELLDRLQPRPGAALLSEAELAQVVAATTELLAYTSACQSAARRLHTLPPVPLDAPCLEFGL